MAKNRIWAFGSSNLLTFRTEAGWEQKVTIIGTGLNRTLTGSGNKIHWQHWTGPGSWVVEGWYRTPGSSTWVPSAVRGGRTSANFNDGGGDSDYNDAQVIAIAVTKSALEAAPQFLEKANEPEEPIEISIQGPEEFDDLIKED